MEALCDDLQIRFQRKLSRILSVSRKTVLTPKMVAATLRAGWPVDIGEPLADAGERAIAKYNQAPKVEMPSGNDDVKNVE